MLFLLRLGAPNLSRISGSSELDTTKRTLILAMSSVLKANGFRNERLVWYRNRDGIVVLIELQKSPYGFKKYSINVGVHVCSLGGPQDLGKSGIPLTGFGPWQLYFSMLERDLSQPQRLKRALDLEDQTLNQAERVSIIEGAASELLPLLERLATRQGIRALLHDEEEQGWLVTKAFREWTT